MEEARYTRGSQDRPISGHRPFALVEHTNWVLSRVSEKSDLSLRALAAELAERGIAVSSYAVWHFLKAQGITSAQITDHYKLEDLPGREVAAVVNFPPKQIGKFMSEILTLGFPDSEGKVVMIQPTQKIPNGGRLF